MYSSRLRPQALRIPSVAVSLPFLLLLLALVGFSAAKKVTFYASGQ